MTDFDNPASPLYKDPMLRVHIRDDRIEVSTLTAFSPQDIGLQDVYDSFDKLPYWLQTKIIKLQMLPMPPPKIRVDNIGSRIAEGIFWVELDGTEEK